jgi:hypothetical protein
VNFHCARIGLKINLKKTKLLRLRVSEVEEVMLANEMIDQLDSFTYLGSIIGCVLVLPK